MYSRPERLESCLRLPRDESTPRVGLFFRDVGVTFWPKTIPRSAPPVNARPLLLLLVLGCLVLATIGCQKSEEIEHYRALKPEVVAEVNRHEKSARREPARPVPTQFLAAIVPQASELWI